mmetsp:Transcript_64527/g.172807  ORF Transcript_64527/g.172807 Transcript_64527/m.172807 type:complete len:141 (+) Transcript_64527:1-423(+)
MDPTEDKAEVRTNTQALASPGIKSLPSKSPPPDRAGAVDVFQPALNVCVLEKEHSAQKFGFVNVPHGNGRYLVVQRIDKGGLLDQWNARQPEDQRLHLHAHVVSVNEITEDIAGMRSSLKQSTSVVFEFYNTQADPNVYE